MFLPASSPAGRTQVPDLRRAPVRPVDSVLPVLPVLPDHSGEVLVR